MPSFSAWLVQQDQRPAYAYLRRYLETYDTDARWVLKTPHHLEWLDVLLDEFPDARIVHTHRDPGAVVPSFCSMVAHAMGMCSDHVDPLAIGRHWGDKQERMVQRALATRDARQPPVLDVHYDRLVAEPMAVIRDIYAFLDTELTPEAEAAIEAQRQVTRKDRYGRHVYDPADFGMSVEGIRERYADYLQRFDLSA